MDLLNQLLKRVPTSLASSLGTNVRSGQLRTEVVRVRIGDDFAGRDRVECYVHFCVRGGQRKRGQDIHALELRQAARAVENDGAKAGSQANGGAPFEAYSAKLAVPGAGGPRQRRIAPLESASIKMTEIGRSPPNILSLMDACRA